MSRPPITAKSKRLQRKQLEAALTYIEENSGGGGGGSAAWDDIAGKPSTFTPSSHTHAQSEITGLTTALSGKAAASHSHAISDVTGLQTALDAVGGDILELPVQASIPSAEADILKVFARKRAGRALLSMIGPSGLDTPLQPSLFGNSVSMWLPGTGTTVAINFGVNWTITNSGTASAQAHPGLASTSDIGGMRRATYGTGTTATGSSMIRTATTLAWRGNAAGRGGWFFAARFGVETFASDIRLQIGLTSSTTNLSGAEPSAFSHQAALIKDSTDANWHLCHNASDATGTKVDTGQAVTAGQILDFTMFAMPNGSEIAFRVVDVMTGTVIVDDYVASTDLPGATTFLYARAAIGSTTGTTAKLLAVNRIYIETDL